MVVMDETVVPTRERIVQAAIACFARSGFHGASMQQICAEAHVSPGALYRHFPGKDTIIAAIAQAERTRHAAFFDSMAAADDPVEAFVAIGNSVQRHQHAVGGDHRRSNPQPGDPRELPVQRPGSP
jgi:AcrR family transcriptional regulator